MNTIVVLSMMSFAVISIAFYMGRWHMILFNALSLITIFSFLFLALRSQSKFSVEMPILFSGLLLYWFGLLVIRVMLRRSVSLHLLASYATGQATGVRENLTGRFEDLIQYKLVDHRNDVYRLSGFGRFIGFFVWLAYLILRIGK